MISSTIVKLSKTIHLNHLFELRLWMCNTIFNNTPVISWWQVN